MNKVESRGKWLLIHFSGGGTLATHMLMSGSWHIYRPGERWQKPASHMRIILENAQYLAVGFHVPVAQMHTAQTLARDRRIPPQTLDVLNYAFDAEGAELRLLASENEEVADVLLHQEVLAGVGNVFKSEICFLTGIHPFCLIAALSRDQVTFSFKRRKSWSRPTCSKIPPTRSSHFVDFIAGPRMHPIQRRVCGSTAARASPVAVAENPFAAAFRAPTRASPSGARSASQCQTGLR